MFVFGVHLSGKWRLVFTHQINKADGKLIQDSLDKLVVLFQSWSGPETISPFGFLVSRFSVENRGKGMKCGDGLHNVDEE